MTAGLGGTEKLRQHRTGEKKPETENVEMSGLHTVKLTKQQPRNTAYVFCTMDRKAWSLMVGVSVGSSLKVQ